MQRVIVTGGAGFIGSALIRHLIFNTAVDVLNVDKLTYAGNLSSLADITERGSDEQRGRYRFAQVDIADMAAMTSLINDFQPDTIMNLAAESHVDRSIDAPADFIDTNIKGTFVLLQAALKYWDALPQNQREGFRFHHISTDEVYGSLSGELNDESLFSEDTAYDPRSPYSASKAASDHLVKAWFHTYGLPVVVTNCSNNYGPYHFPEKLIPLVILNALEEKPLPIYGKGDNIRDWLFVDDHARALELAVRDGVVGETYNVGGRNERTNLQVVQAICAELDDLKPRACGDSYAQLITYVADRKGHDHRYAIDASKLEGELGWRAQEDFASGIRKTVQWYLDNAWWWQPIREGRYAGERLGLAEKEDA